MEGARRLTVVITGATGGIGFYSALGIARTGARVIITGRNQDRGEVARKRIVEETGNPNVELVLSDISSLASVDALAGEVASRVECLDVLVNNAGYFGDEHRLSEDGLEMHFAANVLAPWRLALALRPVLRAAGAARVLNLSAGDEASGAPAPLDVENLQAEKGFKGLLTMAHSKSALEAMSLALAQELEPDKITVNVVFPGRASTVMTRSVTFKSLPGPMKLFLPCMKIMFADDGGKSAAKASTSTVHAATSPELAGVTGRYFDSHCKERPMHPKASDHQNQARIIAVLEATAAFQRQTQ